MPDVKCVLIHDNFQNFKSYNIPKAQRYPQFWW